MAQISIVRKSQLEGAMRLDAEYYQPKYTNAVDAVRRYGTFSELGRIAKVLRGRNPRAYRDSGIPIIRAIDLRDLTKTEDFLYANPVEELFFLKPKDILISSIGEGSIGKVQVFQNAAKCATVSEVSVVRSTDYNPYALATFLRSKYGYLQLERRITGSTGQLHLYPKDIVTVIVPLLPSSAQQTIKEINIEADREAQKSKILYLQAEQLLLDELGFKDLDLSHQLYYTVPFKKTKEANRFDAEHFQPKYEHALTLLGQSGLQVKDVAKVRKDPFKARAGQPFNYIEIGNVHSNGLTDSEKVLGEDAPSRATWVVHTNDVITSTVRPIRRLSALIGEEQEGYVCSSGFVVLQAAGIQPEVFLAFLRLPIVCEILDLKTKASMYPAISTDDLLELPVAVPPKRVSQHIVQLIGEGHRAWRRARQLLEEAKSKVENLIEGKA